MSKLEEVLNKNCVDEIITALKEKNYSIPCWDKIKHDYEPELHRIKDDNLGRKDKIRKDSDGKIVAMDKVSRISIGLEKLHTKRISEFMFALPVQRIYHNVDNNSIRDEISKVLERIYKHSRIDTENLYRGIAYFASCEIFTWWYVVKKKHNLYGFPCDYKLKCKTISPMNGYSLYPLFDEYGDMLAMSFEYVISVNGNENRFFETLTADKHYRWKQNSNSEWIEDKVEDIKLGKIPGIYIHREKPIFDGLSYIREEIEYTLSRNSDVVAYNSAPVLKVAGELTGFEEKGETQRIFRMENGGDVSYVSWSQAIEALKYHVDTMQNLYWMQAQMPDISFANMRSLGNIGYDARMTLLTDSYLKVGEESGVWIEFFERECNVIKAFLALIRTDFSSELDNIQVEQIITPYVQNDESGTIDRMIKANGGKPLVSHIDSIRLAGYSTDAQATYDKIAEEEATANETRISNIFNEGGI